LVTLPSLDFPCVDEEEAPEDPVDAVTVLCVFEEVDEETVVELAELLDDTEPVDETEEPEDPVEALCEVEELVALENGQTDAQSP